MMYKATSAGVIPSAKQKSGFLAAHGQALREGVRDGTPIALGYLAVAFTLGIAARSAGLTAFQGFLASLLNNASAGEYAGFTLIAAGAAYWEVGVDDPDHQRALPPDELRPESEIRPDTPLRHRFLVGYDVTDEIFGIAIARPGSLDPYYNYGAMLVAMPGWAVGTALGILAGDVLPLRVVSALSVALYGMVPGGDRSPRPEKQSGGRSGSRQLSAEFRRRPPAPAGRSLQRYPHHSAHGSHRGPGRSSLPGVRRGRTTSFRIPGGVRL